MSPLQIVTPHPPNLSPKVHKDYFEFSSRYISWMEEGEGNPCPSCSSETHKKYS